MKISDLSAVLSRVQQIAGDVDVVFKDAESEAETVINDLGLHLDPSGSSDGGKLTITHGDAPPAPAQEELPAASEGTAEQPATA